MTRKLIRRISRRRTLQGLGATLSTAALACGDDGPSAGDGGSTSGGSTSTSTGVPGSSSGMPDLGGGSSGSGDGSTSSTGEPFGEDCGPMSDLPLAELLAGVDHVVVLMMENRSFDHYLGALSLEEGAPVDGLTGGESNLDSKGNPIGIFESEYWTIDEDPPHGWNASREQWNKGANDGFVTAYENDGASTGEIVMGYHTRDQLTPIYTLASNFVVCDRWFASVMGPTQPNRFHAHLGHSAGMMNNPPIGGGPTGYPCIFDRLQDARVSNVYYGAGLQQPLYYGWTERIEPIINFFEGVAAGDLPSFSWVDPIFTAVGLVGNDDHPPADIRMGQAFIATVYEALAQSPLWDRCLLILTYDEHGGFFDHVSPPMTFDDDYPEFRQLGFRVPSIVIGPHVRRGCAVSERYDHVSIPATLTRKWDLEPLNTRTEMTSDIAACIDPRYLDDPQPPVSLPPMAIRVPRTLRLPRNRWNRHQAELWDAFDRGYFPRHLDNRGAADETMQEIMRWGERLGVLELLR